MTEKTKREVEMTWKGHIPYVAMDPTPGGGNLGTAEFQFCPLWTRGKMHTLLIYPRQQRTDVFLYRVDLKGAGRIGTFSFHSWVDVEDPRPWRMFWCKEHKGVSYEVYVPKKTDTLLFWPHFGDSLDIHFGTRDEV